MKKLSLKKTTLSRLNSESLSAAKGGCSTNVNKPPVRCTAVERASCIQATLDCQTDQCGFTEIDCVP